MQAGSPDSTDLPFLSACELGRLYRRRRLSPVEVVEAILDRIEHVDAAVNAYVTVTAELARRQAVAAERELARGAGDDRPLLGVPVSIKDLTATKGIRTTMGSLLCQDWVPEVDAPVVERLYEAGAIVLGKTNVPEFGWKGDSGNRVIGPTHNPWSHGRTAGGSSGGAAAAVATGMGPLAQASDGAGSIRIPSSFCGVFGLKPSFGRIPAHPTSPEQVSSLGPIARTVRDAALFLGALAGPDVRDRHSLGTSAVDYVAATDGGVDGLRVAWSRDLGYADVDPEVERITAEAAGAFRALGCTVDEVDPGFADPGSVMEVVSATAEAASYVEPGALDAVRDRLDPGRLAHIESGWGFRGIDVAAANTRREELCEQVRTFMEGYDLLLTPTVPVTAFAAGEDHPPSAQPGPATFLCWSSFTYPFNLTGQPAATVPCGLTADGLPVGLQIIGRWRADDTVLRAAAAFEQERPWVHLVPPVARP